MAKLLECAALEPRMDPSTRCTYVVKGETEEEVLRKATSHIKVHGIRDVSSDQLERVRKNINEV